MNRIILSLIINIITFSTAYSQFTKITDDPIITEVSESRGLAWGDYNNDGFDDLFVVTSNFENNSSLNQLFKNNGDGTFSNITDLVLTEDGNGRSATWGDYDNDGNLDLYVTNSSLNYLYRNIGNGTFEKITTGIIVNGMEGIDSNSPTWGDYNNDGYLDLFVSNYGANNFLFSNNQDGSFTSETELPLVNDNANSISATWVDYNNDGSLDLMVSNYYENDLLYSNDGFGTLTVVENSGLTNSLNQTVGSSWSDFDNDGDFDVFITNNVNRSDQFFINNGDGKFTEVSNAVTDADIRANSSAWGDFDNDGLIDLAIASTNGNYLFRNTGSGFEDISAEWGITDVSFAQSVTCFDYNKDGFLDLYFANVTEGELSNENLLYKNTVNGNNWISIKLIGTNSNRSAIGSKIRLKTANGWQKRSIQSQTGNRAQNSIAASFGLGSSTSVDTILVEWPLKGYQEFVNTNANQFLEITEVNFPNKPTNLNVEYVQESSARLLWSDNSDNEVGFRIERSIDSLNYSVVAETDANTVEYMDSNLSNGTKYYYRVSAMTNGGFSYYTDVVDVFIKGLQIIEFEPLDDTSILNSELTLTTTNSSNLEVLFMISEGEEKISIENNTVTLLDTGRVEIGAYSVGTDIYLDSDTIYQSFQVLRNPQTIEFEPLDDISILDSELTIATSNSSNLEVRFLISEGEEKVSIENNIVTLLDTGRVEIGAYSVGTDIYLDSDTIYQSFQILRNPQTIEFEPLDDISILDSELTITTSNSSNLEVHFLISEGENKVSIENNIVTLLDTGRVEIGAYSVGTDIYLPSDTIYQSFSIFGLPLSINSEQQKLIEVYPIPFGQSLTMSIPASILSQRRNILITTLEGRLVYSQLLKTEITKLDLNQLPNGIYILRIDNWYKRVVKTDKN